MTEAPKPDTSNAPKTKPHNYHIHLNLTQL